MSSTAVVTGASRGIGLSISRRLVADGFQVVGCARTSGAASDALEDLGSCAVGITADVSDPGGIDHILGTARDAFGGVDVLVNNAGIFDRAGVLELTESQWDETIAVNLTGAFRLSQAVAREMVRTGSGGRIVNVASTNGIFAEAGATAYNASKAGLISLTQSFAIELGRFGICTTCVAPGWIDTGLDPVVQDMSSDEESRLNPLGRFGSTDEVAHAVACACDPRASFMNGTITVVDGGQIAGTASLP